MSEETKPRLEFGQLSECPKCRRRKRMPGATLCPDCVAIGRLVAMYGDTLAAMYRRWFNDRPVSQLAALMADDRDYQSFRTIDELMNAYDGWLG